MTASATRKPTLEEWRRAVDKRRFMASRFVRRGASYWNALVAANRLFPLPSRELAGGAS
jgi:hypothetical protein